jgi:hypothetical protein
MPGIGERSDAVLRTAMPGHDERERTKEIRRRNADRRNGSLSRANGPGRAPSGVRTSIGVPPRLWLRRPNATTQPQFRASLTGARKRALPANRPAAVQRCSSQTGRNAGRAEFPKLPGGGLQVRPRVPSSPRALACQPDRVRVMGEVRLYVTKPVTIVNRAVTLCFLHFRSLCHYFARPAACLAA